MFVFDVVVSFCFCLLTCLFGLRLGGCCLLYLDLLEFVLIVWLDCYYGLVGSCACVWRFGVVSFWVLITGSWVLCFGRDWTCI